MSTRGFDFEREIFNCRSSGEDLKERYKGEEADFGSDVLTIIEESRTKHPDKHPDCNKGRSLYYHVEVELNKLGVESSGLIFLPTVDTKADAKHQTDGLFFLPRLFPYLVTIDAFSIGFRELVSLRDFWISKFEGEVYSEVQFQSDLFRFKSGLAKWQKDNKKSSEEGAPLFVPLDFREYVVSIRPENHFVLTPPHVGTCRRRREFANMVARYFAKVSR
ncbi:MAG: hypothetical protein A3A96_01145 [Candidatus Zambryskibacteria bacterium RIFCSPLOWO2_01_FULL_39_39]|uniref:Uncharacterized protein n=1 Tax=Candidatus Zambryskibacteria bacterium RIFCSPLOWO2_01_FULL_39_39 TaxID=1802758 RepID=A0A1G2U0U9_9BACT|nr:MAG: hypothetical protein UT00_C0007G0011 [Parcubacteria group bacterium GW2011_GWA1_38_7]OHA87524.1 MAG: hypothetical protein A2644_04235 [Candidatus Zambryskibacteria bacterium RIFCSPHIGHO2_01_FULL_39_63]OHA95052.1 MAG: hypothetical protein A3B88_03145 [Candidatus Zambryskibacteria bacterium RIFCSPHIGHO2_02_FULL_39_19]OHA98172.1 MAG: hypothetical protein A3F20_03955 [Candidatus Zambryskibacteria bacterium RIFCSPHIGHO2_12_FULL_39_21]OHB02462.1 MAG: hypothetical protein A3A96_01145 [Candidat